MPELFAAVDRAQLTILNLCVGQSNAGMGTFYRSHHEMILLVLKNGDAPHINNFELGSKGRYRTTLDLSRRNVVGKGAMRPQAPPHREAPSPRGGRHQGCVAPRRNRARPVPGSGTTLCRRRRDRAPVLRIGTRPRLCRRGYPALARPDGRLGDPRRDRRDLPSSAREAAEPRPDTTQPSDLNDAKGAWS